MPNVAAGAAKSGRSLSDIAVIVPVMTIVGDSDEKRHNERELVRASMSFYGSTPNYAFIWDEAGFEGTTTRIREKQKAGDFKGMAAQITDEHIAAFATESTCREGAPTNRRQRWTDKREVPYLSSGVPCRFLEGACCSSRTLVAAGCMTPGSFRGNERADNHIG
jgi:Luciferase-like monooxygenase